MTRLDNEMFLAQVNIVLEKNGGKSSVYLAQKRLAPPLDVEAQHGISDLASIVAPQENVSLGRTANLQTYPLLIRVSLNGSDHRATKRDKIKLSTVVEAYNAESFWVNYIQILKSGFVGLKKKDKKKTKGKVTK